MDTSCRCRKAPSSCRRTVIENRLPGGGQGSFTVQRVSVRMDQLETWDLSIFSRPQHPTYRDGSKVEHMTCKFLNVDFPSVQEREKFNHDLEVALRLRDKDEQQYRKVSNQAEFLSHKPNHIAPSTRTGSSSLSRPVSMTSAHTRHPSVGRTSSVVPSLNRYSQSPTFHGAPILSSSAERMSAFPLSRDSSANSHDARTPITPRSATFVPSVGPVSMSPVFSDSFSWTSDLEKERSMAAEISAVAQGSPHSDLETPVNGFRWPRHSGDPWYPEKT